MNKGSQTAPLCVADLSSLPVGQNKHRRRLDFEPVPGYVQWIKQKADSKTPISVSELKYSGTVSEFIQKLGGK